MREHRHRTRYVDILFLCPKKKRDEQEEICNYYAHCPLDAISPSSAVERNGTILLLLLLQLLLLLLILLATLCNYNDMYAAVNHVSLCSRRNKALL